LADDVGDVPSAYRARDWVGHEAGPLRYREALAGSYNLAAVHVLERVGVGALHQLLRRAGVAQLDHAPERYGLALALGSARVRLIDVAAGYGFLARAGAVRRATGVVSLTRGDGSRFYPEPARDIAVLSARASAQVADILMDPAARHRRFGRGLPLEEPFAQRVALKTGTASGMSDLSAIVVSSEFIVAAWSGRFDGAPTQGLSGMWAALPLARRVLSAAMGGREPRLSVASTPPAATPARIDALPSALEPWAERARARLTHKSALVRDR
jgi:penicillin-binding protein 1C